MGSNGKHGLLMDDFNYWNWLISIDFDCIPNNEIVVLDGVMCYVDTESSLGDDVRQSVYITDTDLVFCREGWKVRSYDSWVDTTWLGWELA